MFIHYWKAAIRHLVRDPLFSAIHMTGLSLGLACSILILLYVKDEWSYDRFHQKIHRIYQLTGDRIEKDGAAEHFGIAAMVQGPAFTRSIPEIEAFTRVDPQPIVMRQTGRLFRETVHWVDTGFFSVFSFSALLGDPHSALKGNHSVVLTEEAAQKYFGRTDAIGKTLELQVGGQFETFLVTAVIRKPPPNSSLRFTILVPFSYLERINPDNGWMWVSYPTYFLLHPGSRQEAIAAKMAAVYALAAKDEIDMNHEAGYDNRFVWSLQPLESMHLNTRFEGTPEARDPFYTYMLTGIAAFVLSIACINFINLTIGRSLRRSKEIGIRKAIGGRRVELFMQFLGESLLLCLLSFLLAIVLVELFLPVFNSWTRKDLGLGYLLDGALVVGGLALLAFTGLLAGFYPALVLSAFRPVEVLYGRVRLVSRSGLIRGLVVLQFTLCTLLVIVVFFMAAQFRFLTRADLGYQPGGLVEFVAEKAVMNKTMMDALRTELSGLSEVSSVSYHNIGRFGGKTIAGGQEFAADYERVDPGYLPTLGISLVAGRNFSADYPADSVQSVIVNEAFATAAHWQQAVGKTVDFMNLPGWGNRKITVVGVVRDYHSGSLKEKIRPQLFTMESRLPMGRFVVRIRPGSGPSGRALASPGSGDGALASIEKAYHRLFPEQPFEYTFTTDRIRSQYDEEARWKSVFTGGGVLTVFISCIGLFGLALLSAERRKKEIGIRKVLGAGEGRLLRLIAGDFLAPVFVAIVIAIPIGGYAVHQWLQNFAYRVDLSVWVFALSGGLSLGIALITVSGHAWHAARANPVKALHEQ
ncbi:MAG: ABC transporter permease [Puia sp.]|nr:ABC transporter permease [Puia sp.]